MLVRILAIDLYTIGTAKVLDKPLAAHTVDARRISADPVIVQHQVTLFRPADDKLVFLREMHLLPAYTVFPLPETPGPISMVLI